MIRKILHEGETVHGVPRFSKISALKFLFFLLLELPERLVE